MSDVTNSHRSLIRDYLAGHASQSQVETLNKLMATDASFRDLFEEIERETAPDIGDLDPIAPPAGLLEEILSEIETEAPGAEIVDFKDKKAASRTGAEPWRTIAIISSLAAVAAISLHFVPLTSRPLPADKPPGIALLAGADAPELLIVVYDIEQRKILARLSNAQLPEDAVWQLWLIRDGESLPISLGILEENTDAGAIELQISDDLNLGMDVLAISLEPTGGSLQAGPSGPVLFTGKIESL